jgi:glycosyltransferase involved in cell wall biosynthesis
MTLPTTRGSQNAPGTLPIPSVSVVIPTFNEAENIRLLLPVIPAWIDEIIVVDGRSTDHTVEVAESFAQQRRLRLILETRKGKGAALRAGFAAAQGEIIVSIDADCSMHPCEIPLLIAALTAGADFAKGSRFIQGGGTADMSWFRALGNWGLTQIVNMLYGGSFSDLCYGYFAFWRRYLPVVYPTCDGFEVETFIKLHAMKARLRIAEVPSFETLRIHGASNLHAVPDGIRVLRTILHERYAAARVVEDAFGAEDPQTIRRFAPLVDGVPAVAPIVLSMTSAGGAPVNAEAAVAVYPE